MADIILSDHAQLKLEVLAKHGFVIQVETVIQAVSTPDQVEDGYQGRKVAQKAISGTHVLRVVYEEGPEGILVVTMYPGRRERYEKGQV